MLPDASKVLHADAICEAEDALRVPAPTRRTTGDPARPLDRESEAIGKTWENAQILEGPACPAKSVIAS